MCIAGVGIDAVDIARCASWRTRYTPGQLGRIFSPEEIHYSLSVPQKSAERFAVRFAAKEAFFKLLCQISGKSYPLLLVFRACSVYFENGIPQLSVRWDMLQVAPISLALALTHTESTAHACVIGYSCCFSAANLQKIDIFI